MVNRHWRDRIVKPHERMHWMRGVLMRHLQSLGIHCVNVRLNKGYWEYSPIIGKWVKIETVLTPIRETVSNMMNVYDNNTGQWRRMQWGELIRGPEITATEVKQRLRDLFKRHEHK